MRLMRPQVKRPPETIVALIDVVFFLLVFALLIGRMDATAPFDVAPPVAMSGRDLPTGGKTISISKDGALAFDGSAIDRASLLDSVTDHVSRSPKTRFRINSDGATALRHVLPLVESLKTAGAAEIVLVVTPER